MKKEEVLAELRAYIAKKHRTQAAAAKHWGKSVYWVNLVLNDHREPSDKMLEDAGLERVTPPSYYRKLKGK